MPPATSPSSLSLLVATLAWCCAGSGIAAEPTPDTENGRYTLQPSGAGMIRLDTRSGEVSTCSRSAAGWACYAMPDERKAMDAEIGRLEAENDRLKAELAGRSAGAPGNGETAPKTAEGERKLVIPLPSDQDVDRAMSLLEQTWRRLVDLASRVQKDVSGRI